jgi:hypothetical protein
MNSLQGADFSFTIRIPISFISGQSPGSPHFIASPRTGIHSVSRDRVRDMDGYFASRMCMGAPTSEMH